MKINTSTNIPDSTYFTSNDVQPDINDDGSITIYDGRGTRRGWGSPQVTSTVVFNECDFVSIHVGFSHKHRGGQAWYHYTTDGSATRRITWQQMPDDLRQNVLDNESKAPSWAKGPGKLRTERSKPTTSTRISYKLVEIANGKLVSLYDGKTEYQVGKRLGEAVNAATTNHYNRDGLLMADTHNGGYYSHPTAEQVLRLWDAGNLVPDECRETAKRLALLQCEISGKIVAYNNGKLCSTYIKPMAVVSEIDYTPA